MLALQLLMTGGQLTGSFVLVSLQCLMTEDSTSTTISVDSSDCFVLLPPDTQYPIITGDVVTCTTRDSLYLYLLDGLEWRLSDSIFPGCSGLGGTTITPGW